MKFVQTDPLKLYIEDFTDEDLAKLKDTLSYRDKSVDHQIRTMRMNPHFYNRYGEDWYNSKIAELQAQSKKAVLYTDTKGLYTLSGLKSHLQLRYPSAEFQGDFRRAEPKLIPWSTVPKVEMRPYQRESVDLLLGAGHGNVELATGAGKTLALLYVVKQVGLKSLIVAPSTNIAKQIYDLFVTHLSKRLVGFYGGGKKEAGKLITIGIAQSVTRIEEGSPDWEELSKCDLFAFDECHLVAADTFFKVAAGVAANASHRYFFSATPERNDGKTLLMKGIIGDTLCVKTIKDLIDEGYLAKINTVIVDLDSDMPNFESDNILRMNQEHIYKNKKIAEFIAKIAYSAFINNHPTLILIDEHSQEALLRSVMKNEYSYASGLSDSSKIVEDFNAGKVMCVVGTSAVSIGTDFKPVQLTISWKANKAGTKVKQGAIGRSTRMDANTGKTACTIMDFRITNVPILTKHANIRIKHYQDVGPVQYMKI